MLALAPLLPTIVFSSIARVSIGSLFRDNFAIFSAKNAKFRKLNFWNFGLQNYCFSICESGYFAYAKKPNPNNLEAQFSAGHDVGLVWWWWGGVWFGIVVGMMMMIVSVTFRRSTTDLLFPLLFLSAGQPHFIKRLFDVHIKEFYPEYKENVTHRSKSIR